MRNLDLAILGVALATLAACSQVPTDPDTRPAGDAAAPTKIQTALSPRQVAEATAITRAPAPAPAARASAAQLDTTTREQKAAAAAKPDLSETRLGTTVASLGDPTEGGFWIKTPLVKARGLGRIVNPLTGKSAQVELIPLDGPAGGGSQVSLAALQLIGVSLTDLPTIEVYRF